jgi:DNA modification methylase
MAARACERFTEPSPPSRVSSNLFVVEVVPLSEITPNATQQRRHSERKIKRMMGSIETFDQMPILVESTLTILDGHCVYEACRRLGRSTMAVMRISHLSPTAQRALMMARNRLGEDAKWDLEVLKADFLAIGADLSIDFSMEITGFDQVFIDNVLSTPEVAVQDAIPDNPEVVVTRPGDHWRCGRHGALCGDSLLAENFDTLMGKERSQLTATDVPYNVKIKNNVSGLGRHKHDNFTMGAGELTQAEFVTFQTTVFEHCAAVSIDGALAYFFIDWRHVRDQIEAGEAVFGELKQLVVWAKDNAGMGAFYRSQHELITIWKVGSAPHINNFELGGSGRFRTNVWSYPGMTSLGKGRDEALSWHPTVKPLPLMIDLILDVTRRDDIVLDPFGGSGTALIAAERTGRRARLIEIDSKYVDVTLQRFINETGEQPVLAATGETYQAVAKRRANEAVAHAGVDEWDIL